MPRKGCTAASSPPRRRGFRGVRYGFIHNENAESPRSGEVGPVDAVGIAQFVKELSSPVNAMVREGLPPGEGGRWRDPVRCAYILVTNIVTSMPTNYEAIYAWTSEVFGSDPFTPDQFRDTFRSPDAKKVLSDFRRLRYVDRVERGVYRVTPPDERLRRIVAGSEGRLDLPERSDLTYAYSEATAVAIWTDGSYWTGFTRGLRPLHLNVRRRDVRSWKRFLSAHGYDSVVPGERRTLCGPVFMFHPVEHENGAAERP